MVTNDGKTNFQQKRAGDTQPFKPPVDNPFRVGETYANRVGKYEVLEITPPKITVRYEDGALLVADIAILARIWGNMQLPDEVPEPKARPRAAAKLPPQPRIPSRRRSSGD